MALPSSGGPRKLWKKHREHLQLSQENLAITLTLHAAEIGKVAEKGPLLHGSHSFPHALTAVPACRRGSESEPSATYPE